MQKFLRTLTLMALLAVPWVTQAQTDCGSLTIPYAENFDDYTGNATGTTAPSGYPSITLPDCWTFLNMSATTSTYPQAFLSSSTAYAVSGKCLLMKSSNATPLYAILPSVGNQTGAWQLSFQYRHASTAATNGTIIVGVMSDVSDASTFVPLETLERTTTKTLVEITIPAGTVTNGARLALCYQGGTNNGTVAAIDNLALEMAPTCIKVTNLAIDATLTTNNSLTLTWTDAFNNGATYRIYNTSDNTIMQSGISSQTYTLTGLNPNTAYSLAVMADCGGGDFSVLSDAVTGRTACDATTPLPYAEDFNGYSGFASTSNPYTGPSIEPACWIYYSNGTNTVETTGSAYYGGVGVASGTSYGSHSANNPYLYMPIQLVGASVTNATQLGYATERGNVRYAVLPAFAQALNGLQISFDYKMSTAYSATAAAATLELGYVVDNNVETFQSMQSYQAVTTIQNVVELNLSELAAQAPAGARLAFKFSGVHNGTGTSSYSNVACGIDNILVEELPSCMRVTSLTLSNIASNGVTLNWTDPNGNGNTYTVTNVTTNEVLTSNLTATTFNVTGLNAQTAYTFSVVINCATGSSAATSVSVTTPCEAVSIPFNENFDSYTGNATATSAPTGYPDITLPNCWDFLNMSATTSTYPQVFLTSSTSYAVSGNCLFFKSSSTTPLYAILPQINAGGDVQIQFTYRNEGASASNGTLIVGVMTNPTDGNSFTALQSLEQTTTLTPVEIVIPAALLSGARVAICYQGGTSNNYYASIDDLALVTPPSCIKVSNLAINQEQTTANSLTLTWSDAINTGATYTIYNMDDNTVVASNLTGTSHTINGLQPNTVYSFAVMTDCGGGDVSELTSTVSGRTACAAQNLPWTCGFEENEIESTTAATALPWCSYRYVSPEATSGTTYPYSTSGNAHEGSRSLYYYGTTSETNPEVMTYILPAVNVASYPMNGNRVTFWAKMGAATNSKDVHVGTLTDPTNQNTYTELAQVNVSGTTYVKYTVNLTGANATAPYLAITVMRGTGNLYLDDLTLEPLPTCLEVSDVAVTLTPGNGNIATLGWTENGTATSWQICLNNDETNLITANSNPFTVTGLTAEQAYTAKVRAYCSANDQSVWSDPISFTPTNTFSLTVYEGTTTNNNVPAYVFYWDDFTRSQVVIPAADLAAMDGGSITSMTFYTTSSNIPYTSVAVADVYLKEVNYTEISAYEPKTADAIVYSGTFDFVSADNGGMVTIEFDEPFDYNGGNLLIAIENTTDAGYKNISFYGQTVSGASIAGYNSSSLDNVTATQRNFIPMTTFTFEPPVVSACARPGVITVTDVQAHTATVEWTAGGEETSWNVFLNNVAVPNNPVTTPTYTFTGLDAETQFTVSIYSICGSQTSEQSRDKNFTTTIACQAPTELAAALTPGNGSIATLSWTENGTATAWTLEYGTDSEFTGATTANVNGTPSIALTGLTPETMLYARVKAVCGGIDGASQWSETITFTPTNAYSITVNDGDNTNEYVPVYGYYCDNDSKSQFIIPAADLAAMQYGTISKLTFYASNASVNWGNAQFEVYVTETSETSVSTLVDWTTMTLVKNAGSLSISDNKMEVTLDAPYQYMGGNLMIGILQTVSGSWVRSYWYGVEATGASMGGYGNSVSQKNFLPKTTINYIPGSAPSCPKPMQLAVNYTGGTTAEVSWTSEATAWNLDVNGTVTAITANPYTLTGLNLATTYEVKVQANCGSSNGTSDWTNPVSFTTDICMPADQCELTFVVTDAWGDSWNGAYIEVIDVLTNATIGTVENENLNGTSGSGENEENTKTLAVCNGRAIQFVWHTGNYDNEASYTVTDINGDVIFSGSGAMSEPVTYTVNCAASSCRRPTNVTVTESSRTAQLSWTENGEATAWVVAYKYATATDFTEVNVTTNTYTLTGLTPETGYTVKVRPVCSDQVIKWSDEVSFTTLVTCPAPTELALNGGFTKAVDGSYSANLTWTDHANVSAFTVTATPTEGNPIIVNATTNSATLTGLTLGETYAVNVVANCGVTDGVSSPSSTLSLFVGYCSPNPTSRDGQGITNVAFGIGQTVANADTHPTASPFYGDYSSMVGLIPASMAANVEITYATSYSYGTIIWVDWDNSLTFDSNEVVFAGNSSETAQPSGTHVLTATFTVPATMPQGNYRMRIVGADSYFDSYTTSIEAADSADPCFSSSWAVAEDYTLRVGDAPSCMPVANVTVSNVTPTDATIAWTDTENDATYTIYNMADTSVVASNVTAMTYTLTGLTPNTSYTYAVEANCLGANGTAVPVSFNTLCQSATLPYAEGFNANSESINCWQFVDNSNGSNSIIFQEVDGNSTVRFSSYSSASDYNQYAYSQPLSVEAGAQYLEYYVRYATYGSNDQLWFGYIDANGNEVWPAEDDYYTTGGGNNPIFAEYKGTIPATAKNVAIHYYGNYKYYAWIDSVNVSVKNVFEPTDLTASNISNDSVTLTWTRDTRNGGNETYTITNGTAIVAEGINGNNYVAAIQPNTDYNFNVFAVLGNNNSAAESVDLGVYEFPTETGKMVCVAGSILNNYNENTKVTLYRGLGQNLTEQANYNSSAYLTSTQTNYTESNDWPNVGPMTVIFVGENATGANTGVANLTATYVCPAYVKTPAAVVETANGAYTWTTPQGTVYNYENHRNADLAVNENGDIVATYTDTVKNAGGCDSIINSLQLTLHPDFVINLTDQFCEGTTYTVGTGDEAVNFTASAQQNVPLHTVNGADSIIVLNLQMNPSPVAYINNKASDVVNNFCDEFALTLNARSNIEGVTFQWENMSTGAIRTVYPHESSTYTLIAIDPASGCQSVQPATLTVNTIPVPALTIDASADAICYGQSATLTVNDANNVNATYRWSNNQIGNSITVSPTETTIYTVTATSEIGNCVVTAEKPVKVNSLPVVTVSTDVAALCANSTLTLTATPIDAESELEYKWNTGATTPDATVNPTTSGAYTVMVTDHNGCQNEFTTANVTVYPVYDVNAERSACQEMLPITWGTQTIDAAGNYEQTFQTVNGCDSLVHLTFTIEAMPTENSYAEYCEGATFTFGGQEYTASSALAQVSYIDNSNTCPVNMVQHLTIHPVKTTTVPMTACDTYTWNLTNQAYTASGNYDATLATIHGCDSVVKLALTINYRNTGIDAQTACDKFVWNLNGQTYTESTNEPVVTLTAANALGCDSVVTLNLTVNNKSFHIDNVRECNNTTYTWIDGETYNLSVVPEDNVTYTLDVPNAAGCDSIAILNLTMNYVLDTLNWVNVIACDNYFIDVVTCEGDIVREYISESGDYVRRTRNAETGRDRMSRVHLTISNSDHQTIPVTACVPYDWQVTDDIVITGINPVDNDTIISQELQTEFGCSLIKVLRLHALRPTEFVTPVTLCQNASWTDGNEITYQMADYQIGENERVLWNTTTNVAGCDSTDYVVFTVNPVYNVTGELTYCESDFATGAVVFANPNNADETIELTIPGDLNQQVYTNSVVANWTTAAGCDSVVTITYTVNPTLYTDVTVQNCYTYVWNGVTYNTLGETEATFETVSAQYGCDSIATLHLTLTDTVRGYVTVNACGEYEYNGVMYRESNTFVEYSGIAESGCDSLSIITYNLRPRVIKDVYVVANAPYTWDNGTTYENAVDGIYYDATEPGGCDSILVLHLTMQEPITLCAEALPYTTTYGVTLTDANANNYTETINGVLYDIDYTVNVNAGSDETEVACDTYAWNAPDGQNYTYTESGIMNVQFTDANGCVGTATLNLTINQHQDNQVEATACDTYTWADNNDAVYTESGNYTRDITDANGCAATETLVLTINQHQDNQVEATACDTYTWADNNDAVYTESGNYTRDITDANNCPATETLVLTINQHQDATVTVSACETYTWEDNDNAVYTTSGNFTRAITDANGCAATETLALTINHATENDLTVVRNEASTYYNGNYYPAQNYQGDNPDQPYTFSYTVEGVDLNGCDSIYNVTLYVTRGIVSDETVNECDEYTWARNNHTYVWIPASERQANGNALYKDATDNVYIHTGENPTAMDLDSNGIATNTYVLWLNMTEANHFTVNLGDVMLSDVTSLNVGNDTLGYATIDLTPYIAAHQNATLNEVIDFNGSWYCKNVVTYTANLIYNYDTVTPVTICDVNSWTDPVNGVHTVTIGEANGIDYVTADNWHHHVVVNVTARTNSDPQVVEVCDTYTWTAGNGQTYTSSTTANWNNDVTCTAETLQLTINTNAGSTETVSECDTYTWNAPDGQNYTYTEGGVKNVQFTDINGCVGTATLNLTINTNAGTTDTVTACDSYTWQYMADPLTESNTYTVNYSDVNSCEGVHTLNLTINAHQDAEVTEAACVSYTWVANDNTEYTASGDYTRSIVDSNNCPATETLHLTIYTPEVFTREQVVFGNGITIDGQFYAAAENGVATYTVVRDTTDANGCATTVTINLSVSQYEYVYTNKVGCGSYTWVLADNGNEHVYRNMTAAEAAANPTALYWDETANTAVVEMPRHNDGNMIYVLNLTLNEPSLTVVNVNVPMSQLAANGYVYTTVDGTINCGEAATATANTTVTAEFSLGPHAACDSNVRYNVNVIYNYFTDAPVTLCAQTTYEVVAGDIRTVAIGENTLVYTLNAGTINEEVHTVVVNNNDYAPATPQVVEVCDTYTWENGNGQTYNSSTTVNWNNDATCTAETLQLTINTNAGSTDAAEACDSYAWNAPDGQTYNYTEGGVKTVSFTDANGCVGTATLNLTINTNAGTTETVTECDSYTWQYMPAPLTESNTYTVNYADANGCEGVHTLNLTINQHQDAEFTEAACVTYTWVDNGNAVYDASGDYTRPITDANNCPATETLHLTIHQTESEDVEFWFGEGSYRYTGIYTTTTGHLYGVGDYNVTETVANASVNGCDITYNITLHVGNNYAQTEAVRACDSYTWARNNVTYTRLTDAQSAQYPTALYFDQTNNEPVFYNPVVVEPRVNDFADEYMLDLTLDAIIETDEVVEVPVSQGFYTFDADHIYDFSMSDDAGRVFEGQTITDEIHLTATQYCDSIIHLTINVVNNYDSVGTVDLCYTETSYSWEGHTISLPADADNLNTLYVYNTVGDRVQYMVVNQHPIQYVTERRTECDSYEWRGVTYTESTSGVVRNFTDQYGCDSTVTLVLTINHNSSSVFGSETEPVLACDNYKWTLTNGETVQNMYTESGVYTMDYTSAEGCPSTDVLYLTVNSSDAVELTETACDSYTWETVGTYTTSDVYTHTFTNAAGCDSVVTLNLTINNSSATVYDGPVSACDSYEWHGMTWNGTEMVDTIFGVYTENGASLTAYAYNEYGCQIPHFISLMTISQSNGRIEVTACDSYTWYGETYTESGIYEHVSTTTDACGNFTDSLYLTINHNTNKTDEVAICSGNLPAAGYEWNGGFYSTTGEYYFDYTTVEGCPSTDTLKFTVGNIRTYGREYVENCGPYTWELTGETFTASTEASTILSNANAVGCDSVVYLYLTVNEQPVINETAVICDNALPYTWHGMNLEATGEYSVIGGSYSEHCDSLFTLNLTVNERTYSSDNVVACDSYMWNGETYTTSGVYTYTTTNTAGCDNIATLNLTINQNSGHSTTITWCDTYTWNAADGTEIGSYSASGVRYYEYIDVNGCASVDTLNLTIANSIVNNFHYSVCDSYTWIAVDGTEVGTYDESGNYTYNYISDNGCDGTENLYLTINHSSSASIDEVACDSYNWFNTEYTESGIYTNSITNVSGCDSVITLNLTINKRTEGEENAAACNMYTWNGSTYTQSGDYTYTTNNAVGCDSVTTLHLTINNNSAVTINKVACDSYEWNGGVYGQSGVYTYASTNANGCDSVVTLNLTINNSTRSVSEATACDSYLWAADGQTYDETGIYTYTTTNAAGCDSVVVLNLTINNSTIQIAEQTACDSYEWNGTTYTESGVYTYVSTNAAGCTDVATLTLTIKPSTTGTETAEACNYFIWNGTAYNQTGEYTQTLEAANGCDSVVTLNLTINTQVAENFNAEACNSYNWNGSTYTASGAYTQHFNSAAGCDSVVTLNLTIKENVESTISTSACDSYTWNNETYDVSGAYTQTFTAANGCDSVVTLNLTINSNDGSYTTLAVCNGYVWNGVTYTTSGVYTHVNNDANGCNGTDTLDLTILQSSSSTDVVTACNRYNWNGNTYTVSGNYTYTTTAANGCDSVATLSLTINQPTSSTIVVTACNNYTWNGTTYTTSGSYANTYTAANGCDSVATLVLTVNQPRNSSMTVTACDSYAWNGTVYNQTGNYTYTTTAANGCDSVVTLHLTLNQSTSSTVSVTTCGSFTWIDGQTYTASTNTPTYTLVNTNGCDSVVTLNLTINQTLSGDAYATACSSYIWEGTTYTVSGNYTHNYTAANGCDSVVTMHLTINQPVTSSITATACGSYTWENATYTTTGNYTQTYTAANGCDSVVTLNLTINQPVASTVYLSACDSYTWDGDVYTTTGVYNHTYTAANGCDSVVTLNLTINNSVSTIDEVAECDGFIWIDNVNYTESTNTPTVTLHTVNGCDSVVTLHLTINHSVEVYDTIEIYENQLPYDYNGNTIESEGDFVISGTTVNGCDSTVYLHVNVIAVQGIDVTAELENITVYPNPTRGQSTVTADDVRTIEVFDIVGHLVAKFENTNKIDISNLAEGTYTLRITTTNGTAVRRLIKK